jgi:hypothetical protein
VAGAPASRAASGHGTATRHDAGLVWAPMLRRSCETGAMDDPAARLRNAGTALLELRDPLAAGEPWPLSTDYGHTPESDWGPREVLGHVDEMLPYWVDQLETVLAADPATPAHFGRVATDEEVAGALQMTMEEFYDLVNQTRPVSLLSIDDAATFSNVDKKSILNILESCKLSNPFNQLNVKSVKDIVTTAIEELPEKQRLVLSLYYYEDLNLKEIGKVYREFFGKYDPAMTLVEVSSLFEDEALLEIEGTAVIPAR